MKPAIRAALPVVFAALVALVVLVPFALPAAGQSGPSIPSVELSSSTDTTAVVTVTVADPTGSDTVHLRYRTSSPQGTWETAAAKAVTVSSPSFGLSGLAGGTGYEVQASLSGDFSGAVSAVITTAEVEPDESQDDESQTSKVTSRHLTPFLLLVAGLAALPWLSRAFRPHPEPRTVRSARSVSFLRGIRFALLAVLLLAIMVGSPLHQTPPAEAQTVTTLVSNTGQTSGGTGTLSSGRRAQAFTTGPAAFGYKLSSIGIDFSNIANTGTAGGNIKVTLNSVSGSDPGSTLCTLRDPTTFTGSGVQTFNVPPDTDSNPCPRLRAETTYYVVVARTGTGSDAIVLDMTNSTAEDSGGAYGWSIADEQLSRTGLTWNRVISQAHQIEVKGTAIESTTVPVNWALTPSGLATGDKFRLLFITNAGHAPTSDVISTYNTYVKSQANAGNAHSAIKPYSSSVRVVGCTDDTDARDNTATTYTTDSMGDVVDPVPIYWLNGNKVADQYKDFYDGDWDDETNPKNRGGGAGNPLGDKVWSGCNSNGMSHSSTPLGAAFVELGQLNGGGGPLSGAFSLQKTFTTYGYYALSGVFVVPSDPASGAPTISGTPRVNDVLTADTTDIMDTNGLTSPDYTYQWVRIDGMTETDIGTDSPAYILTDDDAGKKIKVKVTFTDDLSNPEGPLESLPTDVVVAADVLVRNTEQASGSTARILDSNTTKRAMAFTTGASATGYTLTSIGFVFDTIANTSTAGSHLTATLNADSSGSPGSALCTLTDPTSFSASGLHTFDAPTTNPCPTLTANTTYYAVMERVTHVFADTISLKETTSTNEDSGSVVRLVHRE